MKPPVKRVTVAALIAVFVLLVVQVVSHDGAVDTTALGLVLLALALAYTLAAPKQVALIVGRIQGLKFGGVLEVTMRAAERAEEIESRTSDAPDDIPTSDDDVTTSQRPGAGGAVSQYREVREKLEGRLRFIRDVILEMPADSRPEQVVEAIEARGLLPRDERELVRDILDRLEDEVEKMPERPRDEYLDASWHFSVRFGTLVFERLAHKELANAGWFLFHFTQARSHRPDVLAYRDGEWRLIATRIQPSATGAVRKRLHRLEHPPMDAITTLVMPEKRRFEPKDKYVPPEVLTLSDLTKKA
jgi:hypothetical protein